MINGILQKLPVWLSGLLSDMERPENFIAGTERMVGLSKKSREHPARSLKKYCNVTTAEYINELRLNYASNLLLHTNTPILEICFDCGFQSVSYFYKVFKRSTAFLLKSLKNNIKAKRLFRLAFLLLYSL